MFHNYIKLLHVGVFAAALFGSPAHADDYDGQVNAALHKQIFDSIIPDPNPIVVYGEPRGSKIEFLRTGDSTCGKYLYALVTVPPGSGPPPHIHHWTDEWFYAPDGGPMMFMGTQEYKNINNPPDKGKNRKDTLQLMAMERGELVYGPRYIIHGYVNATDKPIQVHIIWTPDTPDVSILGYFISIYDPLFKDDTLNSQFNAVQQIKAVSEARKYGMNFSKDFWQFVKDVKYVPPHGDRNLDKLMELIREGDMPCH